MRPSDHLEGGSSIAGDAFPDPGIVGRLYQSDLFVLAGALLFAAAIPELLHPALADLGRLFFAYPHPLEPALIAVCIATVGVHLAIRQIWRLPFTSSAILVIGAVTGLFALAAASLKLLDIPIGFYHFWTGIAATTLWYLFILDRRATLLRPVLAVIGHPREGGWALELPAHCLTLTRPVLHPQATALVIADSEVLSDGWQRFIAEALQKGIPVYHLEHIREEMTGKVDIDTLLCDNFGALRSPGDYLAIKRSLDTLAALALLPVFLPLLGLAWLAIRCASQGPAIKRTACTGLGGRRFMLLALRTRPCVEGGEDADGLLMTRPGHFLYRHGLVHLPAIFNVLKGEMSWIGPRPQTCAVNRMRDSLYPLHGYRHGVRPGLAGWARAYMGRRVGAPVAREELAYDLFYVRHFSFWLDCIVVFKTISLFVKRRMASPRA